jgi:hypothetical protein
MEKVSIQPDEIKIFGGVGIKIHRCLREELSAEEVAALSLELAPLAREGFMRFNLDSELLDDVSEHVDHAQRIVVARRMADSVPAAFIVASEQIVLGLRLYYLNGIIARPDLQGKGVARYLLVRELLDTENEAIAFTTQNKQMRGVGGHVTNYDIDLSAKIAGIHFPEKERTGNIIKSLYREGKSLYDDKEFERRAIDDVPGMDWRIGDALVLAGLIKERQALAQEICQS